jgi:hypothetical protein
MSAVGTAVNQRTGVRASSLARGILETEAGRSELVETKKPFGIKCKTAWTGKKYTMMMTPGASVSVNTPAHWILIRTIRITLKIPPVMPHFLSLILLIIKDGLMD